MVATRVLATFLSFSSAILASRLVNQGDFTGVGHIIVLNSSDWKTATPKQKVGCLDDSGRFVQENSTSGCGTFTRLNDYPWTLSSKTGNCTFSDKNTETNVDSHYGKSDHAWTCNETYSAIIYDELYTIDGFPYPFLCFGDIACFYDAKRVPTSGEDVSLWQFHWGSQQMGITPGHIQLQLMWSKLDGAKRKNMKKIPSPRLQITDGMQIPLQGQELNS